MNWIKEIEFSDLLFGDTQLVYEHCGEEVLLRLLESLSGVSIYLSEKSLLEIKKRYIIKLHDSNNPKYTAKTIAVRLKVSERFVYDVLSDREGCGK